MSDYRVNLDIFAGPLDLLLYLVRREEVDIYDIPIARITEQYLKYIEMLRQLDVDLAGDFLVMAATLMEIKSTMLLPKAQLDESGEEEAGDPRAELVRQLLEYKRFKDAANCLEEAAGERQMRHTRPDGILAALSPQSEPELDLDQISIWTLLEAFDRILRATGHTSPYEHIHDDTPIDLYQIEILHRLQGEGPMTLERIFEGRKNRLVMIGLFMAMLELIRNRLISAEQAENNGQILLKPMTDEPADQAVRNAIYMREADETVRAAKHEAEEMPETLPQDVHEPQRPRIPIQEIAPAQDFPALSEEKNLKKAEITDL